MLESNHPQPQITESITYAKNSMINTSTRSLQNSNVLSLVTNCI